jgi:hypothetical protein
VPRAGRLRYWSLTILALIIGLGCAAAAVWGMYHLIGTESCGGDARFGPAPECSDETKWHIVAVTVAPFVALLAVVPWALRGGGTRTIFSRFRPRRKRLADQVARGEKHMPTVARPTAPAQPVPSLTPLNRTWPPATWEPAKPASASPKTAIERLQELDELKAKNLISVGDYEAQKKRILGGV